MASDENTHNGHTTDAHAAALPISLRERQRREREDTIIRAALTLMAEVGYDAMTMDDLAERAGISKPTLYQHFPSKEAIAIRAVMLRVESCGEFVENIDPALPAIERIERVVRWVLGSKFLERQAFWPALRIASANIIKDQPGYQARYRKITDRVGALIDEAKRDGAVDNRKNTRVLAQMIFSLIRDNDYQDILAAGECAPQELIDTLVATYLGGIAAGAERPGKVAAMEATTAAAARV